MKHEAHRNGPVNLAAAVIWRAIDDALSVVVVKHEKSAFSPSAATQADARAFCTHSAGEWADARADWCDAVGINPEAVRAFVLAGMARRANRR